MAKGIALTIGLNKVDPKHYDGWDGELTACEADANDMAVIARAGGFSVNTLLTKAATRKTIISEIEKAAGACGPSDIFMLSYSGHGGQIPDRNGDELDNQDETWCLYDGEMLDDEILALWSKFKPGVRILVFSDSCHSGTVIRMAKAFASAGKPEAVLRYVSSVGEGRPKYRYMPPEACIRTYQRNSKFYDDLQDSLPKKDSVKVKARVRLISGCQDNQLSQDGMFNGLFTGKLKQVWGNGRFSGNYADFHSAIVQRMPPDQTPNHYLVGQLDAQFDAQKPFTI